MNEMETEQPPQQINGRTVHILQIDGDSPVSEIICIMDEAKRQIECSLLQPMLTGGEVYTGPSEDGARCVWCYDSIQSPDAPRRIAVGCPVAYVSGQHIRTQVHRGRDDFTIRENVAAIYSDTVVGAPMKSHPDILVQARPPHYKVKYQFCTLNCVLAFASSKNSGRAVDALFTNSVVLTNKLYRTLVPSSAESLVPAPQWSLLRCFGGHMSREVFRQRLGHAVYYEHGDAMLPLFRTYGTLVEEKILLR